jgi:hypothetical protein
MGSSLETIKEAIGSLPEDERAALAAWLNLNGMDEWDRQMHSDFSPGGRGHGLAEKVRADVREGKFGPMSRPTAPGESR